MFIIIHYYKPGQKKIQIVLRVKLCQLGRKVASNYKGKRVYVLCLRLKQQFETACITSRKRPSIAKAGHLDTGEAH